MPVIDNLQVSYDDDEYPQKLRIYNYSAQEELVFGSFASEEEATQWLWTQLKTVPKIESMKQDLEKLVSAYLYSLREISSVELVETRNAVTEFIHALNRRHILSNEQTETALEIAKKPESR